MAVLDIIKVGHPTLKRVADPVREINEEIINLARDMVDTMHQAPGIGLAAPQVNVSKRLITVDLSIGTSPDEIIILINPEITHEEGKLSYEEGCLSVPEIKEKVVRPKHIVVKGIDLKGEKVEIIAEDLLARVFCHEIDHLNGKLFIDRLSPLKRRLINKKIKNL